METEKKKFFSCRDFRLVARAKLRMGTWPPGRILCIPSSKCTALAFHINPGPPQRQQNFQITLSCSAVAWIAVLGLWAKFKGCTTTAWVLSTMLTLFKLLACREIRWRFKKTWKIYVWCANGEPKKNFFFSSSIWIFSRFSTLFWMWHTLDFGLLCAFCCIDGFLVKFDRSRGWAEGFLVFTDAVGRISEA